MNAVRLHPNPDKSKSYSPENPAPSSRLLLDSDIPVPHPLKPGELLVKVEATTIVRDALTWPETYAKEYQVLGHDFAGTVVAVSEGSAGRVPHKPGDDVFGMTSAERGGAWAQYAIVTLDETCLKPERLSWAESASIPMNALTAFQALFEKAGLSAPDVNSNQEKLQCLRRSKTSAENGSILVTGAGGSVGAYIIQLAKLTSLHVVAATSSNERNKDFLEKLGADEVVEYNELWTAKEMKRFEFIIDTVGGKILENCWSIIHDDGTIVSIESAAYDFVNEHQRKGLTAGKEGVKALFFIVSPSRRDLAWISAAFQMDLLESFVGGIMPLAAVQAAYDGGPDIPKGRGKLVLQPW